MAQDGRHWFAPPHIGQLLEGHARRLDVNVDGVEQRPGETLLVAADEDHRTGAVGGDAAHAVRPCADFTPSMPDGDFYDSTSLG
jgi:hypothetical protein